MFFSTRDFKPAAVASPYFSIHEATISPMLGNAGCRKCSQQKLSLSMGKSLTLSAGLSIPAEA